MAPRLPLYLPLAPPTHAYTSGAQGCDLSLGHPTVAALCAARLLPAAVKRGGTEDGLRCQTDGVGGGGGVSYLTDGGAALHHGELSLLIKTIIKQVHVGRRSQPAD